MAARGQEGFLSRTEPSHKEEMVCRPHMCGNVLLVSIGNLCDHGQITKDGSPQRLLRIMTTLFKSWVCILVTREKKSLAFYLRWCCNGNVVEASTCRDGKQISDNPHELEIWHPQRQSNHNEWMPLYTQDKKIPSDADVEFDTSDLSTLQCTADNASMRTRETIVAAPVASWDFRGRSAMMRLQYLFSAAFSPAAQRAELQSVQSRHACETIICSTPGTSGAIRTTSTIKPRTQGHLQSYLMTVSLLSHHAFRSLDSCLAGNANTVVRARDL